MPAATDVNPYGTRPVVPQPKAKVVGGSAGPQTVFIDEQPRCVGWDKHRRCGKLLAQFVARPWSIKCQRCGTVNVRNTPGPAPSAPD